MKVKSLLTKTLLVAAGLYVGANSAWAESLIFTEDFADETYNVTWGGTKEGGVSPAVADGVLKVANGSASGDRSAYITFGSNAYTGCCRLTFDMAMTKSGWDGKNNNFYVLPSYTNVRYPSTTDAALIVTQDYNGAITIAGESVGTYDGVSLTYDLYLNTVTGKAKVIVKNGATEVKTISYETTATGINTLHMTFNKNNGAFAIDNISFYSLTIPAFTLSSDDVSVSVGSNETVNITGITGSVSVSSDNTSVATASYTDGTITINGVADGVAYITVTGTNDGLEITQTISVTVGSVATTTITINYKDNSGNTIKESTTIEDVTVGSTLTASDITFDEVLYGTGFRYVNPTLDQSLPYTVEEDGIINITYTAQAAVTNVKKIVKAGDTQLSSTDVAQEGKYVGDVIYFPFPAYINYNGTLYNKANNSGTYYSQSFTLTANNQECVLGYSITDKTNIVFFSEGEEIEGATPTSAGNNMNGRSSNQQCGYAESDITLANLPAGKYKATVCLYANSSAGATLSFQFGDEAWDAVQPKKDGNSYGATNGSTFTHDFTLSTAADVKWLTSGNSKDGLDYIYIQKTSETVNFTLGTDAGESYKSYVTTAATDFAATGVTAYIAKAADTTNGTVTLSIIEQAPVNTPVLLKGTKGGSAEIATTTEDVAAVGTNYLAAANNTAISSSEAKYVLAYSDKWEFRHYNGTLSAGKVYLDLSALGANAATLSFVFEDETTGISAVEELREKDGQVYNLSGQRVNQPTKGLYIVNGKKYIAK